MPAASQFLKQQLNPPPNQWTPEFSLQIDDASTGFVRLIIVSRVGVWFTRWRRQR
jgi:hypothetical protein